MDALVIIVFVSLVFLGIVVNIYNHTSHSKTNGKTLRKDALICDIKTENVGGHKMSNAAIRTTVTFDDGFVYISHKCKSRMNTPLCLRGTISVDREVIEEIKKDAFVAHEKAYENQSMSNQYAGDLHNEQNNKDLSFENNNLNETIGTNTENEAQVNIELFSSPHFDRLFQTISFLKNYEISEQIELTMYALVESRLFLQLLLHDSTLSKNQQRKLMNDYDLFQYAYFDVWLEDRASDLRIDADVLLSRIEAYDEMMQNDKYSPTEMLELTLYWFLQNDVAFERKKPDFISAEDVEIVKQKYYSVYKCVDSLVFEFCKNNMIEFVTFYVKKFCTIM